MHGVIIFDFDGVLARQAIPFIVTSGIAVVVDDVLRLFGGKEDTEVERSHA